MSSFRRMALFTALLMSHASAWAQPAAPPADPATRGPAGGQRGAPGGRGQTAPQVPAWEAQERIDQNSRMAHQQLLEKRTRGRIDVYFAGDSIVRRWGATDYPALLANWTENFRGWHAANFGWGADRTQNILWRLQNGELDGVNPKVIVLLAGTNNVGSQPGSDAKIEEISRGVQAIVNLMRVKVPAATIIVTAIFPRNDNIAVMPTIDAINANLAKMADGRTVRFLNVNDRLADPEGRLLEGVLNPDRLHPSVKGYQIWADALKPIFRELLGPPAATDLAPPPTGDPSAAGRGAGRAPALNHDQTMAMVRSVDVLTLMQQIGALSAPSAVTFRSGRARPVTFTLQPGESIRVDRTTVRFIEVISESRCPLNALCVHLGDVVVAIDLTVGGSSETFELALGSLTG